MNPKKKYQLKLDPGSKTTGIALLKDNKLIWAAKLTHQMCGKNKYGSPTRHRTNQKIYKGFQTGDIVKAVVTKGKKIESYMGRVLVHAYGSFDISTDGGRVAGISHKYCFHIHKKDGYQYSFDG